MATVSNIAIHKGQTLYAAHPQYYMRRVNGSWEVVGQKAGAGDGAVGVVETGFTALNAAGKACTYVQTFDINVGSLLFQVKDDKTFYYLGGTGKTKVFLKPVVALAGGGAQSGDGDPDPAGDANGSGTSATAADPGGLGLLSGKFIPAWLKKVLDDIAKALGITPEMVLILLIIGGVILLKDLTRD